jgi:hypothetical protein
MELAELEESWCKLDKMAEQQKTVTKKIILDVIRIKYDNKLRSILKYEGIGTLVLFLGLIVVIWNIDLFDTWPLRICALLSIVIMTLLPILSLRSVYRMHHMDMSKRNYRETIVEFTRRRKHFLLVQKWGMVLSAVFMFTVIPITLKIVKGKDFFAGDSNNLLWFIPIAFIVFYFFARWGYGCYVKITADAQNILQELEE